MNSKLAAIEKNEGVEMQRGKAVIQTEREELKKKLAAARFGGYPDAQTAVASIVRWQVENDPNTSEQQSTWLHLVRPLT